MININDDEDAYSLTHRTLTSEEISALELLSKSLRLDLKSESEGSLEVILSTLELRPEKEPHSRDLELFFLFRQMRYLLNILGRISIYYSERGDAKSLEKARYLADLIYNLPEIKGLKEHWIEDTTESGVVALGIDPDKWYIHNPSIILCPLPKDDVNWSAAIILATKLADPRVSFESFATISQYIMAIGNENVERPERPPVLTRQLEIDSKFFRVAHTYRIPINPTEIDLLFLAMVTPSDYHLNKILMKK